MEIQQLCYFLTVAETGNLTKAAKKLHTVQSNVTVKIKQLEQELGHTLFERSKQGMALTERGQSLIEYAKRILETQSDIIKLMASDAAPSGQLSIACLDSFIRIFLGKTIPKFVKFHPQVELSLQTGFNPTLFQMLDEGSADLIGVVGNGKFPSYDTVFSQKDKLILLSNGKKTTNQPLLILGEDCFFGNTLTNYFEHYRMTMKISSIESILASVNAGIGITLLPQSLIHNNQYKQLVKIPTVLQCEYSLLRKKNRPRSSAEEVFIRTFRKENSS